MYGDAELTDVALVLTPNQPGREGAFTVPMHRISSPIVYFAARMEVLFGRSGHGQGGDGMHIFFGAAPTVALGLPLSDGLSLIIRTRVVNASRSYPGYVAYEEHADLYWQGAHIMRLPPLGVRSSLFREVGLDYREQGLRITWAGEAVADGIQLPSWLPQANWSIGAAAATGKAHGDHHWIRSLHFQTRRLPSSASIPVRVSTNAQQYTAEAQLFTYYGGGDLASGNGSPHSAPPVVSAINPSAGPISGGTHILLSGSGLAGGDRYTCMFGSRIVSAELILAAADSASIGSSASSVLGTVACVAPNTSAIGSVPLRISPNAQQYGPGVAYTYHSDEHALLGLSPAGGPLLGGTRITLHGAALELGAAYACDFEGVRVPAALAPPSLEDYATFTAHRQGVHPAVVKTLRGWPTGCTLHQSTAHAHMEQVAAALAACHHDAGCDSVYYNDCDASPHPLYLCKIEASFPGVSATDACAFRKIQGFRRAEGFYCRGAQYGVYSSTKAALAACNVDPHCGAVYDSQCIGNPGDIRLCSKDSSYEYQQEGSLSTYAAPLLGISPRGSCVFLRPPWRTAVQCTAPPWNESQHVRVAVSLNGQQFFGNQSVGFEYLRPERVHRISPSSGPELGGTLVHVSGADLYNGSDYNCAFGASVVAASYLPTLDRVACVAPAGTPGSSSTLEVSLNAQQFTSDSVAYSHYGAPVVSSFHPSAGPSDGDALVVVRGASLGGGSDRRCRFGACGACASEWSCGTCVVNATFVAATSAGEEGSLRCLAPPLAGMASYSFRTVALEVSLNSQQYTDSNSSGLGYSFYRPPVLLGVSPSLGPLDGSTQLVVNGTALDGGGTHLLLRFNSTLVAGTLDAGSGKVVCAAAPGAASGAVSLSLSLNGVQFSAAIEYRYYAAPRVSGVVPAVGPTAGGTLVQVIGSGMVGGVGAGPEYRCRFGNVTVAASLVGEALHCVAPSQSAATLPLEISLNGQQFSSDGVGFHLFVPPVLSSVSPSFGPTAGGIRITMSYANLHHALRYRCVFNVNVSTPATLLPKDGALVCVSPPGGEAPLQIAIDDDVTGPVMFVETNFSTYPTPTLSHLGPDLGPLHGGTLITVNGENFPSTGAARCVLGASEVVGTLVDTSTVQCILPTLHSVAAQSVVMHDFSQVEEDTPDNPALPMSMPAVATAHGEPHRCTRT